MAKGTCNEQGPFGAKALPDLVVVGVDLSFYKARTTEGAPIRRGNTEGGRTQLII